MKTAKRVLALLLTLLMLTGGMVFPAGAEAADLQSAIDKAAAGDTVLLAQDMTASVVIDKDLTLDLGGHELVGEDGEHAIVVKNADVTVRNGHVYSRFEAVPSVTLVQTVKTDSPAAIRVYGGKLTVEGVRIVGSMARVPTTKEDFLPTGSAIEAVDGAQVTVIRSSLVGRYGVNNKVNNASDGGAVVVEDGILAGFMRVVKDMSKLVVPAGTEDVNAADRLPGFLNKGVQLEAREKKLMQTVFADRLHIYTKAAPQAAAKALLCTDDNTVEVTIDEAALDHVWENNTSTDCSYRFVPEALVAGGKSYALTRTGDGTYTAAAPQLTASHAKDSSIRLRLQFELQPDVQAFADDFDANMQALYTKALQMADDVYAFACEKYDQFMQTYMASLYDVDDMLMVDLDDRQVEALLGKHKRDIPEYRNLTQKLFALGGAVMATKGEYTGEKLPASYVNAYTGSAEQVEPVNGAYIYGVLDRVAVLKQELDALMGGKTLVEDDSRLPELVLWAYDHFEQALDILDDAETAILELKQALTGDTMSTLLTLAPDAQKQAAKLDTALQYVDALQNARDTLLGSSTVRTVLKKLANNRSEIQPYVRKFMGIFNNSGAYFIPADFRPTETALKGYAVSGGVTLRVFGIEGHNWSSWEYENTFNHERGCRFCGAKETEEHNYVVTKHLSATHTEDGYDELTCVGCGDVKISTLKNRPDHVFSEAVVTEPTCETKGYTTYICEVCGESYTADYTNMLGHDWDYENAEVIQPASCTVQGERRLVCLRDPSHTTIEKFGTIGHQFMLENGRVTPPTCTEEGYVENYCSVCGQTFITEHLKALGHDWKTETTAATCTEDGRDTYVCTRCGATTPGKTIPATGHAWDEGVVTRDPSCTEPGLRTFTCANDAHHTYAMEIPALGHNYEKQVIEPTCLDGGYTIFVCTRCSDSYGRTDEVPPTGHRWNEGKVDYDPTCTLPGKMTYTCLNDLSHTYSVEIAALGHDWQEVRKEATCTEDGYVEYVCTRCGEKDLGRSITLPKGHKYDSVVTPPTCESDGYTTYVCSACGDSYVVVDANSATGHDWDEANAVVKDATCTADGEIRYVCLHDAAHILDKTTYDAYKAQAAEAGKPEPPMVIIPALGHKWHKDGVIAPTCGEEGYTVYTCERCGVVEKRDVVAPTGEHYYDDTWSVSVEPGCTTEGVSSRTCLICGHTQTRPIAASGHVTDEWVTVIAPTCTAEGTRRSTCLVCGENVDKTDIPALGHDWLTTEVVQEAADCLHTRIYHQTCKRDVSHTRTLVEKGPHQWGEWVVVEQPTTEHSGKRERICLLCGEKEEEVLDKLNPYTPPVPLQIRDSATGRMGERISVPLVYTRKGDVATQLTAIDGRKVTYVSSDTKAVTVDQEGHVRFTRLSLFHRRSTIVVRDENNFTATCEIQVKYRWYHYLLWFLFGCLWY